MICTQRSLTITRRIDYVNNQNHSMNKITSVSDAIEIVNELAMEKDFLSDDSLHPSRFPFGIWFRGQANREWSIEPGVFRAGSKDAPINGFFYDEADLILHLRLRASEYLYTHPSALDWLCLAQHYSMPTRLLDWTESILFALYFAVKDDANIGSEGILICLNAKKLNFCTCGEGLIYDPQSFAALIRSEMAIARSVKQLKNRKTIRQVIALGRMTEIELDDLQKYSTPVAIFPYRTNPRMIYQQSVFTLHGGKCYDERSEIPPLEKMPHPRSLEEISKETDLLKLYVVPIECKPSIEDELFRLGIHEGTLFPEIDRQAAYLKKAWARSG